MQPSLRLKLVQGAGAVLVLAVIGLLSVWTQQPWLVPSLGSAAFVQTLTPKETSATPWSIGVGQLCGVAGGFLGVYLLGAQAAAPFVSDHALTWVRLGAVVVALAVTVAIQLGLKATSAAGATLALLLSLGAEPPSWASLGALAVGVALVTGLGEIARRTVIATMAS